MINMEEQIRYISDELLQKGNLEVIETGFAQDYKAHAEGKLFTGHEFIIKFTKQLRTAITNIKVTDIQVFATTENTITHQRKLEGIHTGNMMGIPASGNKVVWYEMLVTRFEGERIAEDWLLSTLAGELLLKQSKK